MNKQSTIGFVLLAVLVFAWTFVMQPSRQQIEAEKQRQQYVLDSLAKVKQDSLGRLQQALDTITANAPAVATISRDSMKSLRLQGYRAQYGVFAEAVEGSEETFVLENDLIKATFSNRGGRVTGVELKAFKGYALGDTVQTATLPVRLFDDPKNAFTYLIPLEGLSQPINTQYLYCQVEKGDRQLVFRIPAGPGGYFEQTYALRDGQYALDYSVRLVGLENALSKSYSGLNLIWEDFITPIEKSITYEQSMTTVNYRVADDSPTYCDCNKGDDQTLETPVDWMAHTQQFFTTALLARTAPFSKGRAAIELLPANNPDNDLKKLYTELSVPVAKNGSGPYQMQFYFGPNDYDILSTYDADLESVVHYGWSFFGAINKYLVRPLFNLLSGLVPSFGLCIILLTLLVKTAMYPLQYKMILSGVKMQVLRPQINKLKEKYGDDQQRISTEQMKIFGEYGVNPLGGCLPALLQTPIWIALYRFFPASIDFRQESFLWANDLVSADHIFFTPLGGISLFTVLWLISMLAYAKYSASLNDTGMAASNPALQYMPYIFPFVFFFALNTSASGLTCYMFFSNLFNIGMTLLIKNVLIDEDKVREQLEAKKKELQSQPRKKSFAERLEDMQREQLKKEEEKRKRNGKK
jgi:YidC/Oxa1 family membrane protein insertase